MNDFYECNIRFDTRTLHSVDVRLFRSKTAMHRYLKAKGFSKCDQPVEAAFWQYAFPAKDGKIGCLYFYRGLFSINSIAHESTHAAWCRANIFGLIKEEPDDFEECVATSAGNLTENIIAWMGKNGKKVLFEIKSSVRTVIVIDKVHIKPHTKL